MTDVKVSGLLISAGLSGRMGEFKPLMKFNGETFVAGIVNKLSSLCDQVVIVTGFKKEKIETLINSQFPNKVACIYNPHYTKGMFTSLKAGIEHFKDSDWVLYHFVDQPFFSNEFYKEMIIQVSNEYDWVQPVHNGREGHPVMFNKKIVELIRESPLDSHLRKIRDLSVVRENYWDCGYPEVLIDFDTKDDLEKFESGQ